MAISDPEIMDVFCNVSVAAMLYTSIQETVSAKKRMWPTVRYKPEISLTDEGVQQNAADTSQTKHFSNADQSATTLTNLVSKWQSACILLFK
jgi:hypothetical protein